MTGDGRTFESDPPGNKTGFHDVGIKAIAKALNLSASTVSRALNGVYGVNPATRKLVQETAKAMGYVPHLGAKQLVGKGSNMIGVFIPQFEFEASTGFIEMFSPIQQALQSYGKDAIFFSVPFSDYPKHRLTEFIGSRSLEGCLLFPAFSEAHPIMQEALELEVPCVNFEDVVGPRCSSVISDDREGGRLAGRQLLQEGHCIIGYMNGPPHLRICKERYAGFCDALREVGIAHDSRLVAVGDFSGSSGAAAAIGLKESNPEMTALFCANDLMAMGAIMEFTRNGISIPGQLSVMGYDGDTFTAYTSPPLTTILHAREEICTRAVELLMGLLAGNPGRRDAISPRLLGRQSTARMIV
ncbi:LacI family DNA-binding transcriptional regulator [Cohnella luojiensis]|uniref:LacI family transcriptional regulator n=1 Tax=Cohnella luojiensis TaxID=652876 RepID=A0A4Y8LXJ3_9BACL|nr:LacI family DNA-binding transcriptional regulator [Cohnella luojiensis]TFE25807.1 LacI family transcriptional regulator [Cohnella luojiensis]